MNLPEFTPDQALVISAYTGYLICPIDKMHLEIERRLGHGIMSHMLGNKEFVEEKIRPLFLDDFLKMAPNYQPPKPKFGRTIEGGQ